MAKKMKILCICERGNSRSSQLGWLLKDGLGHDAIAMGIRSNSGETKHMLYKWAEMIILLDEDFITEIPQEYHKKLKVWNVGKDRFFSFSPELVSILKQFILEEGWEWTRKDM